MKADFQVKECFLFWKNIPFYIDKNIAKCYDYHKKITKTYSKLKKGW